MIGIKENTLNIVIYIFQLKHAIVIYIFVCEGLFFFLTAIIQSRFIIVNI